MDRPRMRLALHRLATCIASLALIAAAQPGLARAADTAANAKTRAENERFFEQRVRPLLAEHCHACHAKAKTKGNLSLDSIQSILEGGDSGPAVLPGKPDESLLVQAVNHHGLEMPPSAKLPPEKIAIFAEWVSRGAPWPGYDRSRPVSAGISASRDPHPRFTDDDRHLWSLQPIRSPRPPATQGASDRSNTAGWPINGVDAFITHALTDRGLTPADEADKTTLIRRVTFDVTGLPPAPEDVDAFLRDQSPHAYEHLVDRLLASPRYGQHWARHWLDLVRYAESDGHRQDAFRPSAWRYRDYVIDAFNSDKPYDQFVTEQLAGDELDPSDPDLKVAVGYLRLGTYEYNQRNVRGQWADILNDITDVTGETFLGLSIGCARCHDHKFDPIPQRDYYRLQAFFTPLMFHEVEASPPKTACERDESSGLHQQPAVVALLQEIAAIEKPYRDNGTRTALAKFPDDIKAILEKPDTERSPLERQIGALAYRQVQYEHNQIPAILKGKDKERWSELKQALTRLTGQLSQRADAVLTVTDVGPQSPLTVIPTDRNRAAIEPGALSILQPEPTRIGRPSTVPHSTGRRLALARWLTQADNPLTARVIVNRIWQYHFGRGLVSTASDFGRLGETPSHPELLDWLASNLVTEGWQLKPLHRLILLSAAYRQSSRRTSEDAVSASQIDPENRLLWHFSARRLSAEEIRDAMLSASGELDQAVAGPSSPPAEPRRAIATRLVRNSSDPVRTAFDGPDGNGTLARRYTSTTATQALLLLNGEWVLSRARALAAHVQNLTHASTDNLERITLAYRRAFGRYPTLAELNDSRDFMMRQSRLDASMKPLGPSVNDPSAFIDFCHVLLNSNEFFYVD